MERFFRYMQLSVQNTSFCLIKISKVMLFLPPSKLLLTHFLLKFYVWRCEAVSACMSDMKIERCWYNIKCSASLGDTVFILYKSFKNSDSLLSHLSASCTSFEIKKTLFGKIKALSKLEESNWREFQIRKKSFLFKFQCLDKRFASRCKTRNAKFCPSTTNCHLFLWCRSHSHFWLFNRDSTRVHWLFRYTY